MTLRVLLFAAAVVVASCSRSVDSPTRQPGLWGAFERDFAGAHYIDLTHPFAPGDPVGTGFGELLVGPARAAVDLPGLVKRGDPFSYDTIGAGITAYTMPTDQLGTQLDPPAHGNARGATISDIPATVAIRPLVVINVSAQTHRNPGYVASINDVAQWERRHGPIPVGSVVMFRTDWSKKWSDRARFTRRPFPGIALQALEFLHSQRHILFHGHEPLDTDTTPNLVAERWLLAHNFMQAEGVANLDQVPEAGALVAIGFAKPLGGTGGLARFIAIAPADWPHGSTVAQAPGAPLAIQRAPLKRGPDGVLRARP